MNQSQTIKEGHRKTRGRQHSTQDARGWYLTAGELKIVTYICQGQTTAQICQSLCLAEKTLQTHLGNIYRKIGGYDRVDLIIAVLHNPLIRDYCFPELQIKNR